MTCTLVRATRRHRRVASLAGAALVAMLTLSACLTVGQDVAFRALNADRTANGRKALTIDATAQKKAQAWADHLAATGTVVHSNLYDGFANHRVCSIGENVGSGPTVKAVETAYMASTTHRTNILGTKWNRVGVGYAQKGKVVYVVQVFVKVGSACPVVR